MSDPLDPPDAIEPALPSVASVEDANGSRPVSDEEIFGVWAVCLIVVLPGFTAGVARELSGSVRPSYLEHLNHLASAAAYLCLVGLLVWHGRVTGAALGIVRPLRWSDLGLGLALTAAAYVAYSFVDAALSDYPSEFGLWGQYRQYPIRPKGLLSWSLAVAQALGVGAGEELLFRGYLLTRLEQIFRSSIWAVVVSSVAFGGCHIYQGVVGSVGATAFGVLMAVAFLACRRIWPVALAHALYDLLPYILAGDSELILGDSVQPFGTESSSNW